MFFMVCLSVAGSIIAGVHYYAVDLQHQQDLQAPANTQMTCSQYCDAQYYPCMTSCKSSSISATQTCRINCQTEYKNCKKSC
jgi:hypothetical protein